jgi:hypothetical protein
MPTHHPRMETDPYSETFYSFVLFSIPDNEESKNM